MNKAALIAILITIPLQAALACDLQLTVVPAISNQPFTESDDIKKCYSNNKLDLTLAKNEYEPASFIIHNKGSSTCSNINITPNENKQQKIANQIEVDIRIVKRWFQAGGGWKMISKEGTPKIVPELLVYDDKLIKINEPSKSNYLKVIKPGREEYINISHPDSRKGRVIHSLFEIPVKDSESLTPISLKPGDIRQIWITAKTQETTVSGDYFSEIEIKTENNIELEIPIKIRVLPFQLQPPRITYSMYYRGKLHKNSNGSISSEIKSETQYIAELQNMKQHGICCPTNYQGIDNKKLFSKSMLLRKEILGDSRPAFLLGLQAWIATNKNKKAFAKKQASYLTQNKSLFGVSDYYLYGKDEAKGKKLIAQKKSWEYIKNLGLNIFAAGYKGTFKSAGDLLDILVLAGKPNKREIKKFHDVNKKVFTYAFPQSGPENPYIFRRNFGLRLWQNEVDGAMPYAYHDSARSIWNDFDHKNYRDHNFTYPTINGVIDTIAWEGFREGVDDVRYITTLENYVQKLKGDKKCLLSPDCSQVYNNSVFFLSNLKHSNLAKLDETRSQIASHIIKLEKYRHD